MQRCLHWSLVPLRQQRSNVAPDLSLGPGLCVNVKHVTCAPRILQLLHGTFCGHAALGEDDDVRAKLLGLLQHVGCEKASGARVPRVHDRRPDLTTRDWIKTSRRLVQESQRRVSNHGTAYGQPSPHTSTELSRHSCTSVLQTDCAQKMLRDTFSIDAASDAGEESQVVQDGHVWVERRLLRAQAKIRLVIARTFPFRPAPKKTMAILRRIVIGDVARGRA
mmetsp:Transcript_35425/g.97794  ORF Transcript_35425/g.97794 Transcript_35425/m.97794 type:complete len:221 (+) Transcript_35425:152-814(+)